MNRPLTRRNFFGLTALTSLGIQTAGVLHAAEISEPPVRIGVIGVGNRGCSLLDILFNLPNVKIPAICDSNPQRLEYALSIFEKAGQPKPETYSRDDYAYEELIARNDLDAILIATPWNWHAKMAVSSMKAGKYTGVEVPAAITLDECWELIDTFEKTGVPCMMLENWSFRRDNLAVLNMIREGLFGEIVHSQGSYSHNCVAYFFSENGKPRWQGEFLKKYNRDQYPTHDLGPILSWMNINCGDRFDTLVSVATASFGVNQYYQDHFADNPSVEKPNVKQGDIVSTIIKTKKGKTIYLTNDTVLPRPYDNRWLLQGTKGIYSHEHNAIYLEGRSPQSHTWEPFVPYQEKYEHKLWKNAPQNIEELGHGGPDYFELAEFVNAVRAKAPTPIDIYDSVAMSSVVALSGQCIENGGAPVLCPDFTRGKWETTPPKFAL